MCMQNLGSHVHCTTESKRATERERRRDGETLCYFVLFFRFCETNENKNEPWIA